MGTRTALVGARIAPVGARTTLAGTRTGLVGTRTSLGAGSDVVIKTRKIKSVDRGIHGTARHSPGANL